MPTDWDKWDSTSARLMAIETHTRYMKRDAGKIGELLRGMKQRPDFETMAEDALRKLDIELATLSAFVRACRDIYSRLEPTA